MTCPRNLALFNIGINTNLRASDLTWLKVGQVRGLQVGDSLVLREKKTKKSRMITINKIFYESVQNLLASKEMQGASDSANLFQSRKLKGRLRVSTLSRLVKKWAHDTGLQDNHASHSMRKTFGMMHFKKFKTDLLVLVKMFNHSSPGQTLEYIGIQPDDLKQAYLREI